MGITSYSSNRDANGSIPPGDIRANTFEIQQIVNAIRQLMADLAGYLGGPITLPGDLTITGDIFADDFTGDVLTGNSVLSGGNRIDQWVTIKNEQLTGQTTYNVTDIGGYRRLRINMWLRPVTTDNAVSMRWSSNNGVSYFSTAGDYLMNIHYTTEAAPTVPAAGASATTDRIPITFSNVVEATGGLGLRIKDLIIDRWNVASDFKQGQGFIYYHTGTPDFVQGSMHFRSSSAATLAAMNAFRILLNGAGTFDIDILVEGQR